MRFIHHYSDSCRRACVCVSAWQASQELGAGRPRLIATSWIRARAQARSPCLLSFAHTSPQLAVLGEGMICTFQGSRAPFGRGSMEQQNLAGSGVRARATSREITRWSSSETASRGEGRVQEVGEGMRGKGTTPRWVMRTRARVLRVRSAGDLERRAIGQ